jgi:hypothetical protein
MGSVVSTHKEINSPQRRKERKAVLLFFLQVYLRTLRLCGDMVFMDKP